MKSNLSFNTFTNLYPVSKTLRFELIPIGKTIENFRASDMLEEDFHRADSYKEIKKLMDDYHKTFIDNCLHDCKISEENLEIIFDSIGKSNLSTKYEKAQQQLRIQIATVFKEQREELKENGKKKDKLVPANIIKELAVKLKGKEEEKLISEFDNFATYFEGYKKNRNNLYSKDAKAGSIAFRLINENLPIFIGNMKVFDSIKEDIKDGIDEISNHYGLHFNDFGIKEIFSDIHKYAFFLTQGNIDLYNTLIGGTSEGDVKIKGLNEYVNLFNQANNTKLPKFKNLKKQILSDRVTISWLPEQFGDDNELLVAIKVFHKNYEEIIVNGFPDKPSLKSLLANIHEYDTSCIYLSTGTDLTKIMSSYYGYWNLLNSAIEADYEKNHPIKKNQELSKYQDKKSKFVNKIKSLSLDDIDKYIGSEKSVTDYFLQFASKDDESSLFDIAEQKYDIIKQLLESDYKKDLKKQDADIEKIKDYLDSINNILWFIKPLYGTGNEVDRDGAFYSEFDRLYEELRNITPLYNKVRNYLTQKPYSEEKIKLNFSNPQFLAGWDLNKESERLGVILRRNSLFYLAIMDKKHNKVFNQEKFPDDGECYEKIDYKQISDPKKDLPHKFLSESGKIQFRPSHQIIANYNKGTHKEGENFNIEDCRALIGFYKKCIDQFSEYRIYNFNFSEDGSYNNLNDFYREVQQQAYKLSFRKISESYINKLVDEGKIYLFKIYNKDFSSYSKGTPNIHTLYWKALFSDENLNDVVYKLNGQAEVFFRKSSPSIKLDDEKMKKGFHYEELKDKFAYPIIKDRRFTMDKFHLHINITGNFKSDGDPERIKNELDTKVRTFIKNGGIEHIIGIDRGERNLLYLSLIDLNGNIVKQFTLNEITSEHNQTTYKTNYHSLLGEREADRMSARRNWKTIENIKDLKEGYLSQVIHLLTQMMVKYRAIIVLENLNTEFMRGRLKVEKSVYQKFEKMLVDKLNYLVDKKKPIGEDGGLMKAYQLSSKFTSLKDLEYQNGFIFYIPAWKTSTIDPVTGFSNFINTKYESVEKARELLGKFNDIRYNSKNDYFEFFISDYTTFNPKAAGKSTWTICTYGDRINTFRNQKRNNEWDSEKIVLSDKFKELFSKYDIDYGQNLLGSILIQDNKDFFVELLHLLGLTLQLRNSVSGTDKDYIISPVADSKGIFFDSREYTEENAKLPIDADANGAFNIARKGLIIVNRILLAENLNEVKFSISSEEWLKYVQKIL